MEHIYLSNLIVGILIALFLLYGIIVSKIENQTQAVTRLLVLFVTLPLPFFLIYFLEFPFKPPSAVILIVVFIATVILLFFPYRGKDEQFYNPVKRIDERDTMFSRNDLIEGSKNFLKYYSSNPKKKLSDDKFRNNPGLLKPGSSQYNPIHFAAADASFNAVSTLKSLVKKSFADEQVDTDKDEISLFIKNWAQKLGALNCGFTELKDYHLYSVGGRDERYGKEVINNHKYAIAFTVEMNKTMVDSAPTGSIVMESAQQYFNSGSIAVQIAEFIRNLGYEATAHIDANYEVVCPLVARDAGLGEIGRMGLLMTPKEGPRVRIAVVTTSIPLITDSPLNDNSVIDFCVQCKKCAEVCPSNAISFNNREEIDGIKRWQINSEVCFTFWTAVGTDCGRCVAVCPYSHPDNLFHNIVRTGIRNSKLFRKFALIMDDFIYCTKPKTKDLPEWLNIN